MLIARLFGLTGAVGLSVAVTRRLRAIFWTAVGGFCLFLLSRSKATATPAEHRSGKSEILDAESGSHPLFTSVIFVNTYSGGGEAGSPLMRVGALPILLRNILSVQKAVGNRIIVCVDPVTKSAVQSELLRTNVFPMGRVARSTLGYASPSTVEADHIRIRRRSAMLVAGNSTYYPALFREAKECSKRAARWL